MGGRIHHRVAGGQEENTAIDAGDRLLDHIDTLNDAATFRRLREVRRGQETGVILIIKRRRNDIGHHLRLNQTQIATELGKFVIDRNRGRSKDNGGAVIAQLTQGRA